MLNTLLKAEIFHDIWASEQMHVDASLSQKNTSKEDEGF